MKLKNVSKLLLFFITTIILSCSQDDPNENFKQESIKTSFVNFEKLYSVDNVFQNAFNSLIVNNKNTSGVTAKSNLKKIYGFTIANDPIKIVEKNGRLSYNIALQPKTVNLNIFENIVLNVDKNGNQNALHITYFRTSANHHEGNFKGFAKVKLLTNSNSKNTRTSSDCYTIEFIYCANADGVTHFAGQGDCEAQPQRYIACFSHDQSGGSTTETIDFNSISFVPSNYESPGGNSDSFEPTYVSSPNEPKDPEGFTNDEDVDTTFFEFITKLSPEQQFFLFQNKTIFETVNEYLDKNKNPFGEYELKAVEFIKQLIDLASMNGYDEEQLKNWFFVTKPTEGFDGEYNNNLENTFFQQQNPPSFLDFFLAYPSHFDPLYDTSEKMYYSIGGDVKNKYVTDGARNTCALRISKALNYSGITIPYIKDVTLKGSDGKYYFLVAANLLSWMKKTFGNPSGSNHLTEAQGGLNGINFPSLVSGKKGIYIMIPKNTKGCDDGSGFCASGHADILENQQCDSGGSSCYFNAAGGVKDIFIWELP